MNNCVLEERVNKDGYFLQTISGRSMYPMLRDKKDVALIVKPSFPLKKYDVPLYKTADDKYVLHRIIKIKKGEYIIRGDNTFTYEYGVKDENIVGVLTAFYRSKKYIKVTSLKYKIYVRLNVFSYPIRFIYVKCKNLLAKIYRKIFKKK